MSHYEELRDRFLKASTLEKDHKALLESVAGSAIEKLAAYLEAPPERVSVKPAGESANPRIYSFSFLIGFGANGSIEHSIEVPVVMTLTRHGLNAKVAGGHDQHVGDPAKADWHEVFYDVLATLEKECQARESKSRL